MLKIIAVGDPHFKTDNIPEVNLFIKKMQDLAEKEAPDLIVILGDILHTHEKLFTVPLNKAYEFIDIMRNISEVVILVGNHDMCNNQQYLNQNHWMNALKEWKNVTIADTVISRRVSIGTECEDRLFVFSPYVPNGKFIEALNTCKDDWKDATCIFAHQEFLGCKMGAFDSVDGDKWELEFPPVLSGHIHDNQTLENIYYCGSSMQHSFGDSEKHIIPILTWEGTEKKYVLQEVDLQLPKKKTIYQDVSNVENLKIPTTEDKVKVTLSGDYEEFKAFKQTKKYQDIVKTGTKVIFKPKKKEKKETNIKELSESTDFKDILFKLVEKSENKKLLSLYKKFIN